MTVPDIATPEPTFRSYILKTEQVKQEKEKKEIMRFAGYVRVSSEEQVTGYSLDAQKRQIQSWVQGKEGTVVRWYVDEGESALTADRSSFQQMRRDASKGRFDALVVHKFDRFARNRTDALAIKSLLRYDYKIKVFSVSEPSEDSDGPIGALIEGIMESVADWYSRNLATEVAKGKRERALQGLLNNQAPFGYDKNKAKILVKNDHEFTGLLMGYESYSTAKYSDAGIAQLLNDAGYRTKRGRPFSKDTVRDMLQNQTYLGKVKYQQTRRNSDRTRSYSAPVEWFDGQHEPLISQELFDRCQEVRQNRAVHRQATPKYVPYLLRGLVYCYRCCTSQPQEVPFPAFGKMRCQAQKKLQHRYYRCRAKDFDHECAQGAVKVEDVDGQVVSALKTLKPPEEWRKNITRAMSEILGEQNLEERLAEIHEAIERMDFRWDQGFITDKNDYLEKRVKLQQELEHLTPVADDELEIAADMLANFGEHWDACGDDTEKEHELVKLIVERVYVQEDQVVAMTLKANYHFVLGQNAKGPTTISVDPSVYTSGSDGGRSLTGYAILPRKAEYQQVVKALLAVA